MRRKQKENMEKKEYRSVNFAQEINAINQGVKLVIAPKPTSRRS